MSRAVFTADTRSWFLLQATLAVSYNPILALGAYVTLVGGNWCVSQSGLAIAAQKMHVSPLCQLSAFRTILGPNFNTLCDEILSGSGLLPTEQLRLEPLGYVGAIYPPSAPQTAVGNINLNKLRSPTGRWVSCRPLPAAEHQLEVRTPLLQGRLHLGLGGRHAGNPGTSVL